MPYASLSQMRFMHAKHPKIAAKWDKEHPKGKKMPKRVEDLPPPPPKHKKGKG